MLLQAKTCVAGYITKPDEPQYELYNSWPSFELEGTSLTCGLALPGQNLGTYENGRYALISKMAVKPRYNKQWQNERWRVLHAQKPLAGKNGSSLGASVLDIIDLMAGVPFDFSTPVQDDWSKLMKHLLTKTFSEKLTLNSLLSGLSLPGGISALRRGVDAIVTVDSYQKWVSVADGRDDFLQITFDNPGYSRGRGVLGRDYSLELEVTPEGRFRPPGFDSEESVDGPGGISTVLVDLELPG